MTYQQQGVPQLMLESFSSFCFFLMCETKIKGNWPLLRLLFTVCVSNKLSTSKSGFTDQVSQTLTLALLVLCVPVLTGTMWVLSIVNRSIPNCTFYRPGK